MKLIILLIPIVYFLFISCSSSTDSEEGNYELKGTLTVEGIPLSDASVQVDEVLNWKTTSDSSGNFKIAGITAGEHILKATKSEENDSYVELESTVNLTQDITDLGEIRLPIPPTMYNINTDIVRYDAVTLNWSQATDPEFREYKVYRRDNPGLDENTGELIFVSTYRNDTSFVDEPPFPGTQYYYRVYILSAFGKLGGSNLVNVLVPAKNLVKNPDFEESSDGTRPDVWKTSAWYNPNTQGYVSNIYLDSTIVKTGKCSGKIVFDPNYLPSQMSGEVEISQQIEKNDFEVGVEYQLSMWIKTGSIRIQAHLGRSGYWWGPFLPAEGWLDTNTDWAKYSATFTPYEDDLVEDAWVRIFIDWETADSLGFAWIDDVRLSKVTN